MNSSPPRANPQEELPGQLVSPASSCVSSEVVNQDESTEEYSSSLETSMMLVGCRQSLMYGIVEKENPKCPKCKGTVLIDVALVHAADKARKG
ncbi:hypothetical protein Vadar_017592 [Vaccinium darrowii]|uniref:Uncharacterized protein n=1 Tax=Vaccinium darrowii TaxID=229202 RepID=A0ACB7XRL8_9ERIC|nr:hypothetical protein Vadar_017592 [Vaccinium darrowii]